MKLRVENSSFVVFLQLTNYERTDLCLGRRIVASLTMTRRKETMRTKQRKDTRKTKQTERRENLYLLPTNYEKKEKAKKQQEKRKKKSRQAFATY